MELPITLQNKIIEFLRSVPTMHDSDGQRAFIYQAGLDPQLQDLIPFSKPPAHFFPLLVSILAQYGRLNDGRYALEAVLRATMNYIGQDRKEYCEFLLQKIHVNITEESLEFNCNDRQISNPSEYMEAKAPSKLQSSSSIQSSAPIESPYGTMSPDSPFYIERQADNDCWHYLNQAHAVTIFVQAPRQMGKSSLMRRIIYRAKQTHNVDTAFIDLEKFTKQQLEDEEAFLIEFCLMIGDALHIPDAIDDYWTSRRSNLVKCSNYISQHIIATHKKPFILAIDEMERLLHAQWHDDFFGMLRTWHNDRAWDINLAQMSLFLSSSTEPQLFIDNPHQSPFNVAEPILLRDFTLTEVEDLNQRHQSLLNPEQVKDVMGLLGGHPFLTRLAFYLIWLNRIDLSTLRENALSDDGPFGEHLRRYWRHLLELPDIKQSLMQICLHHKHPEDKRFYRLKGAGLIKKVDSQIVMRNKLYADYFAGKFDG